MPFDVKLADRRPPVFDELTEEKLDSEIQKEFDDAENGIVHTAEEVEKRMKNR